MTNAKRIVSKFDGTCTKCNKAVKAGMEVLWTPGVKGVTHVKCPAGQDITVALTAAALQARMDGLQAKLSAFAAQRQDFFAERNASDSEDLPICEKCTGSGVQYTEFDQSWTQWSVPFDFSDIVQKSHRCGTKLTVENSANGSNVYLVDGNKEELVVVQTPNGSNYVYGGRNETCCLNLKGHQAWNRRRHTAEMDFDTEFPEYAQIEAEIALCAKDMEIRKGDIATVINRGKPYTGKVTFVGEGTDFSRPYGTYRNMVRNEQPMRVSVVLVDGSSKGGDLSTAKFVSREAVFSSAEVK